MTQEELQEIRDYEYQLALDMGMEDQVRESIALDMNSNWETIPDRINEFDDLGDRALEDVIEAINNATNWLDAMYKYAGPNGKEIKSYEELQEAMTPRDWAIYCMLNRLECDLHI